MRALAVITALALGGCQYLIGIQDTKDKPDGPPIPIDSAIDAPPDAPPVKIVAGTGADGALEVATGVVAFTDDVRTILVDPAIQGSISLHVGSSTGFAIGDEILIMQMSGANGGQHETVSIMSTLTTQLATTPLSGSYEGQTQIIRVPNYTTVAILDGGTLTAHAWDGMTGGVVFFRASAMLDVQQGGSITASEIGFSGGAPGDGGIGGSGATGGDGGFLTACPALGCGLNIVTAGNGMPGAIDPGAIGGGGAVNNKCFAGAGAKGGVFGNDGQPGDPGGVGDGPGGGGADGIGGSNATSTIARPLAGGGGAGGTGGDGGRGGGGGGGGGGPIANMGSNGSKGGTGGAGGAGGIGGIGGRGGGLILVQAQEIHLAGSLTANGGVGTDGAIGAVGEEGGVGGSSGGAPVCNGFSIFGGRGGGGGGANGGNGGHGSGGGGGGVIRLDGFSISAGGTTHAIGAPGTGLGDAGGGGQGGDGFGGHAPSGQQGAVGISGNTGANGLFYLRYVDACTSCSTVGEPVAVVQQL